MKSSILKFALLSAVAAILALGSTSGFAQEKKETPPAEKKDAPKEGQKKRAGTPGRGKVEAIDKVAKTVKIGERTLQITSETRLRKAGKPATLEDGVVGEDAGFFYKEEGGKLVALSVRFGPASEGAGTGEKKKKKE